MNVLLHLAFNGARYGGWQHQNNALAVSDVVLDALKNLFGAVDAFHGCSRTDSGVHAYDFCVSFAVAREMATDTLCKALNARLPDDIRALRCEKVSETFHARYDVKQKEYIYRLAFGDAARVFEDRLALVLPSAPDMDLLNREAAALVGTHDFSSFMAAGSRIEDATRTVYSAYFVREGDEMVFHVSANGFLYNMVRIFVGTLLDVADGKLGSVAEILAKRDRRAAGRTAPAHGLYLYKVTY